MQRLLEAGAAVFVIGRTTYHRGRHELAQARSRAMSLTDQAMYEVDRSFPGAREALRWAAAPLVLPVVVAALFVDPDFVAAAAARRDDYLDH